MINSQEFRGKSLKMSNDTMLAASHTSLGLVDLAKYLLGKHSAKLQYILLGKIQSDNIEGRFGHLRKLAWRNYWASVRQFYKGESVIRARSLVSFSGCSIDEVKEEMKNTQQDRLSTDNIVIDKIVNFLIINPIQDLDNSSVLALSRIAGYLGRCALNRNKCSSCQKLLVGGDASTVSNDDSSSVQIHSTENASHPQAESNRSSREVEIILYFLSRMNRGKLLLVPSPFAWNVTEEIRKMYLLINRDDILRVALFNCNNSRLVFSKAVVKIMSEKMDGISCSEFSHKFVDGLLPDIAHSLFNCFCLIMWRKQTVLFM